MLPRSRFDLDSGLQFTETIRRGFSDRPEWTWKTLGSAEDVTNFRSTGPGCASLQDMAIRHLCRTINYITPELLQLVPWSVGKRLWERIVKSNLESLLLWKTFVMTYPDMLDVMGLARREQTLFNPALSLSSYCLSINSSSLNWISILSLNKIDCTRQDLVSICNLINLGLLKIGQHMNIVGNHQAGLEESIIRNWARAATENKQFKHLRVLVLHDQRPLSDIAWNYLDDLPALSMVLTYDCHELVKNWQESKNPRAWPSSTKKNLRDCIRSYGLVKKDRFWESLLCALYRSGEPYFVRQSDAKTFERVVQLPILQLALGSNVIERGKEFVLFQRADLEPARKRVVEEDLGDPSKKRVKKAGLGQAKGHHDIAQVLEAFGR